MSIPINFFIESFSSTVFLYFFFWEPAYSRTFFPLFGPIPDQKCLGYCHFLPFFTCFFSCFLTPCEACFAQKKTCKKWDYSRELILKVSGICLKKVLFFFCESPLISFLSFLSSFSIIIFSITIIIIVRHSFPPFPALSKSAPPPVRCVVGLGPPSQEEEEE